MRNFEPDFLKQLSIFVIVMSLAGGISHGQDYSFHVGNSLTQDTIPQQLSNSDWHIYCSKNLDYIYNNPEGHCTGSSTPWTTISPTLTPDDTLIIQPFDEDTVDGAAFVIGELSGNAGQIIVHTSWWQWETFPDWYENGHPEDSNLWAPSPAWFTQLLAALPAATRLTRTHDVFYQFWVDGADLRADYGRDFIHASLPDGSGTTGRDIAHNCILWALKRPLVIPPSYERDTILRVVAGDMNRDGRVTLLDIEEFVGQLSGGNQIDLTADCNFDGVVNLLDVEPFINLLN